MTIQPFALPPVRNNCAFCGRERTPKDDNHDPTCPYWDFFGPPELGTLADLQRYTQD